MFQPKKSLGQNFLTDKNIAKKIVSALECIDEDYIIEIGPGTGVLTELLLENNVNLTSIDIDHRSVELLNNRFSKENFPNFQLIESDIRDFNIQNSSEKAGKKLKIIGNIPYNISSDIFFWLFESASYIDRAVLTIQKEVAKRLTGKPHTKDYGILTIALNLVGKAKIAFDIPASCFYPKPNVTSSVIIIDFNEKQLARAKFDSIMKLVRAAFNQRRKVLSNSLKSYIETQKDIKIEEIRKASIELYKTDYLMKRPEELTVTEIINLFEMINKSVELEK
jgi:16S rRNA (adenine1518-N6/adenine1519-N6)-dimethyltransferase